MNNYDIVFVGHVVTGEFFPFEKNPYSATDGASTMGAAVARCCTEKVAVVTRMAREDEHFLQIIKNMNIDIYLQYSRETTHLKLIYPTTNVDSRQIFQTKCAGFFSIEEMPPVVPCLIHLCGLSDQEFTMDFMKKLKEQGHRLSIDMQGFLWEVDNLTRAIRFKDLQEKEEILHMVEVVKLDQTEAKVLTGTDNLEKAAAIIDKWGCPESLITCSDGVLAYKNGASCYAKFTNTNSNGRTGRGDTTMGAYLARSIDHSVDESVRFAAAAASIKMETEGPFTGTLEDIIKRMEKDRLYNGGNDL